MLDLCTTFTLLRHLELGGVLHDSRSDEVLRAISTYLPQLEFLDISRSNVSLNAIRYLLPTKDRPGQGCPELVAISLWEIKNIDVEFLKNFIVGLSKLKCLLHLLLINVLTELTDEEACFGSFKCLVDLRLPGLAYRDNSSTGIDLRYNILQNAPKFASTCNITKVDVSLEGHSTISLTDLLMPLAKLNSITLHGLSDGHEGLLTVLESKGNKLQSLHLLNVIKTVELLNITRTCQLLRHFTMTYAVGSSSSNDSRNVNGNQTQQSGGTYGLYQLNTISVENLNKQRCSGDMMVALLVSPYLKTINLTNVEEVNDGVMACVQSCTPYDGLSTLTSVEQFCIEKCPNITATSLVRLLNTEGTMLTDLCIKDCDKVDGAVLYAAVAKYPKSLDVTVSPISPRELPEHVDKTYKCSCVWCLLRSLFNYLLPAMFVL